LFLPIGYNSLLSTYNEQTIIRQEGLAIPTIPNFPPALLEEHRRWHHANHLSNPANIPRGYGERFLRFHRDFIGRALQWYAQMGYDLSLVQPWQEVPAAIRNSPCYNQAAEMRIRFNPQSFATADELGAFIEGSNLHGCIHQEGARVLGEPDLNDFDVAPRITYFYNIHTMIDGWYQQWERAMGLRGEDNRTAGRNALKEAGKPSPVARRKKRKTPKRSHSMVHGRKRSVITRQRRLRTSGQAQKSGISRPLLNSGRVVKKK